MTSGRGKGMSGNRSIPGVKQFGKRGDGRVSKEIDDRDVLSEGLFETVVQQHREQRMATERKEVVVKPYLGTSQH